MGHICLWEQKIFCEFMYSRFFKRVLDFLFSALLLLLLSPVLLILIVLLFLVNKKFVFFIQERPGLHGKVFKLIKFKTMTDNKNEKGELLPNMKRLTKTGSFLRSTSLDELPQLLNVIKGDMSLVGPRPLLVEYLPLYSEEQSHRHDIRPGITGWAQVNGRNAISWKQKFELDVWYVDNVSLRLDIKILFLTLRKIFQTEEVNASNDVTMEKFDGQN